MKMIELEQNTPEWLAWRKDKLGASDAGTIMGENPYCSPLKLWKQKLGIEPENFVSEAMKHGARTEKEARELFEKEMGKQFFPTCVESLINPFMIASLDGLSQDGEIVEIKCPHSAENFFDIRLHDGCPKKYYAQLQHQMYVCEKDYSYLYVFYKGDFVLHTVDRDDDYIERLVQRERDFYESMLTGKPPEFSEKDYVYNDSDEWVLKANQLAHISGQIAKLEDMQKTLKDDLIHLANGKKTKGFGVSVYKTSRKGSIDTVKLDKELAKSGKSTEDFRKKPTESWCVRVD